MPMLLAMRRRCLDMLKLVLLLLFPALGTGMRPRSAWCFQIPIVPAKDVLAGCRNDLANLIHRHPTHHLHDFFLQFYCDCQEQMSGYEMCKTVDQTKSSWCCGPLRCKEYFMESTYNATVRGWPPDCGPPEYPPAHPPTCPKNLYSIAQPPTEVTVRGFADTPQEFATGNVEKAPTSLSPPLISSSSLIITFISVLLLPLIAE